MDSFITPADCFRPGAVRSPTVSYLQAIIDGASRPAPSYFLGTQEQWMLSTVLGHSPRYVREELAACRAQLAEMRAKMAHGNCPQCHRCHYRGECDCPYTGSHSPEARAYGRERPRS